MRTTQRRLGRRTTQRRVGRRFAALGAAPAWTPASLPNLVAWYDGSLGSTVFEDAARTNPAEADDEVLGVADLSGNGYHLSHATTGPHYKTAVQNGLSALLFDGVTGEHLANTTFSDFGDAMTWVFVGASANVAAAARAFFTISTGTTTDSGVSVQQVVTTGVVRWRARDATTNHNCDGATDVSDGVWRVHVGRLDDTQATEQHLWLNGGAPAGTANTYDGPNPNVLNALRVGTNSGGGSLYWNGYIGEIIICSSALSLANVNLVGAYAATKWGTAWVAATE